MITTYDEAVEYILETPKFTTKHSMKETGKFYEFLGLPLNGKKIVHVAGTNGKGSVCSFIRCVLEESGYHTATFVSPHLVDIRERFLFDGIMAGKEEFLEAFNKLMEKLSKYNRGDGMGCEESSTSPENYEYHPSFFEFVFFMFTLMERAENADYIVIETGLGGRLDATNIIPDKTVTVITEIGLDHTEYLGDSITDIAMEKAGILRKDTPVIYLKDNAESAYVIEKRMRDICGRPDISGLLFGVRKSDAQNVVMKKGRIDFTAFSFFYKFVHIMIKANASYQVENALLALRALDALMEISADITKEEIMRGFSAMFWEGRMQEIMPDVYVDGAHNEDGIRKFLEGASQIIREKGGKASLLFAVMKDKRYEAMVKQITASGLFERICFTKAGGNRGTSEDILMRLVPGAETKESAEDAFAELVGDKKPGNLVFVAGSLYLVGDILKQTK